MSKKELARPADFFSGKASKRRYAEKQFEGIGTIRIRNLSELERKRWQTGSLNKDGDIDLKKVPLAGPRLMTIAIIDENDNRQFTDGDVEKLAELDSGIIGQIVEWIQDHCGFEGLNADAAVGN